MWTIIDTARAAGELRDTRRDASGVAGGLELHLGVVDGFLAARKAHPGILVDDLDDGVATCARRPGGRLDGEFPGFRRGYAQDPFGSRVEFRQPM